MLEEGGARSGPQRFSRAAHSLTNSSWHWVRSSTSVRKKAGGVSATAFWKASGVVAPAATFFSRALASAVLASARAS